MARMPDPALSSPRVRLFFSLWPDAAVRRGFAAWGASLQEAHGGRIMQPQTLHLTLAFIGDVAAERLPQVLAAGRRVSGGGFELAFSRSHLWPHNGIVHAVPECVPEGLARLTEGLHIALGEAGFPLDTRPYRPHVTLLRRAGPSPDGRFATVRWPVRDFVLLRSLRTPQGARYAVAGRFPLLPR